MVHVFLLFYFQITAHCLGDRAMLHEWLVYDPRRRIQGWRFISYMLLHSDALHLTLNVVIQLVLATPLEVSSIRPIDSIDPEVFSTFRA